MQSVNISVFCHTLLCFATTQPEIAASFGHRLLGWCGSVTVCGEARWPQTSGSDVLGGDLFVGVSADIPAAVVHGFLGY